MIESGHFKHGLSLTCARMLLSVVLILSSVVASGQKVTRLEILNAELTAYDIKIGKDARKLIGNVQLKHEDVVMSCDSAYFYSGSGSVDAFSRVKVVQGDTLTLTGDFAHYNGETKIAQVRNNVKLENNDLTLDTDSLDYFRLDGVATYRGGGILQQGESRLTSERGRFLTGVEIFYFMDSVHITDPQYEIFTDSMKYDTKLEISHFDGPTEIFNDKRYIYCENGWYDTRQDISFVTKNAFMEEGGRTISGDTLYYEATAGFGRANSNVVIEDSAQNMTLKGNFALYYSDDESAMVTDSALMIQVDGLDSLYVHADTLRTVPNMDSIGGSILKAWYKVKIYRPDLQSMCDSLVYIEADSTFTFFGEPVLWSDENQLTASNIEVLMKNQQLERMEMTGVAMVISQKDSVKYDQMRGKTMTGYFRNNQLHRIDVNGNGQTLYYALDQGVIVGANKTECTNLSIFLKDSQISRVNYMTQPGGTYYPLDLLPAEEARLPDFKWALKYRPLKWQDVFIWKNAEVEEEAVNAPQEALSTEH